MRFCDTISNLCPFQKGRVVSETDLCHLGYEYNTVIHHSLARTLAAEPTTANLHNAPHGTCRWASGAQGAHLRPHQGGRVCGPVAFPYFFATPGAVQEFELACPPLSPACGHHVCLPKLTRWPSAYHTLDTCAKHQTQGFRGKRKNCFSIAVRAAERAMQNAYIGRKEKKRTMRQVQPSARACHHMMPCARPCDRAGERLIGKRLGAVASRLSPCLLS